VYTVQLVWASLVASMQQIAGSTSAKMINKIYCILCGAVRLDAVKEEVDERVEGSKKAYIADKAAETDKVARVGEMDG